MEEIIQELRQDFINDLPNALDEIMASHMSGDMEGLFQAVHKLKGAAAVCQFDEITEVSENYCAALKEKRFDDIDHYQAEMVMACSQLHS